ncbi:MAG: Gfo/Idh/MocA family oxidoreductase [Actinobacteria bacterium]|nr:Gfo/Idh/MocA family oxidoreductase [Actinomycetota bacterium]
MTVRWGFLGAGFVASRGLAPAVHLSRGATLYAVASRDEKRSESLEPERVHANYDELLSDERVDAVYISLSNVQHDEWVTKSLEAGKHVLCEKPLGLNAAEVETMFECASRHGRLLVEAVWGRWHPRFARLVGVVESGAIGGIEHIETSFTFVSEMTDNYRLNPKMGGGALLDVGCYQAHAWVALTSGAPDVEITRVSRMIGPTGVDLTTDVAVRIRDSITARAVSSFAMPGGQQFIVRGSHGQVSTESGESFTTWNESSSLRVNGLLEEFDVSNAFIEMVENVSRVIVGDQGWIVPSSDSMRVAEILDLIAGHPQT